ncbi:MAG TPA: hypothetical protein VGR35_20480 [Tepidisphaeraceae bacterium]|nr:hypothetical protein [Tepidisphaeraceae bacterium]
MRRTVRPWLFRITASLSVMGAVVIAVLWCRSYFYLDSFKNHSPADQRFVYVVVVRGGLQIARCGGLPENRWGDGFESSSSIRGIGDDWQILTGWGTLTQRSFGGFRWASGDINHQQAGLLPAPFWSLRVPLYLLFLMALVLPSWWFSNAFVQRRRARRARAQQCEACGYDLRETPERCPECGRKVAAAAPAAA